MKYLRVVIAWLFIQIGALILHDIWADRVGPVAKWAGPATAVVIGLPALVLALGLIWQYLLRPKGALEDARWGTIKDAEDQGLRAKRGLLLGTLDGKNLVEDGDGHIAVVAGTRSGKGTSFVIPQLLLWPGSVIVLDVKEENWRATARSRAAFSDVIKLDWNSPTKETDFYNPLSEEFVRRDPFHVVDDIQKVATQLLPLPSSGGDESKLMWVRSARDLFLGIVLFLIDNKKVYRTERWGIENGDVSLAAVRKIVVSGADCQSVLGEICEIGREHGLHEEALRILGTFSEQNRRQFDGVKGSLSAPLTIFASPLVGAATSRTSFDPKNLRRKPTSIYLVVRRPDIEKLRPILSVFVQQMVDHLESALPGEDEPVKVLCLLDEFRSLGHMPALAEATATLAGFNVRLALVFQSLGQLSEVYGSDAASAIWENMSTRVMFAPNDNKQAKVISEAVGDTMVRMRSTTARHGGMGGSVSESISSRALLTPAEAMLMKRDQLLILAKHGRPIMATQKPYYEGGIFAGRYFDCEDPSKTAAMLPQPPPALQFETKRPLIESNEETCEMADPRQETAQEMFRNEAAQMMMEFNEITEAGSPKVASQLLEA